MPAALPPPLAALQPPRGMRDILPQDEAFWDAVSAKAKELSRAFGYGYIATPILEYRSLFLRGVGEATDIVQKEMYFFKDQGGDTLALRPEGTAAVARAYINHGMVNLPQPVKLWYRGPFFRRERPQAGRYRQFHQWGLEALGDPHPVLDAEIIAIAMSFFKDLDLPVALQVNSLGCVSCRVPYREALVNFYQPKAELLCESCKGRLKTNPLRLLDCQEAQCELLREGAPQLPDMLCDSCREHFMRVLEYLDDVGVAYNLNPHIVRGLDYYTRTTFEIFPAKIPEKAPESPVSAAQASGGQSGAADENPAPPELELERSGRQSALGGGGRYDGLVEELGGRSTPAVGFSMGLERVVGFMRALGKTPAPPVVPKIFIAQLGEGARRRALALLQEFRKEIPVAAAISKDGLKAQLEIANRLGVRYAIIIGQKEIIDKTAIIRDMEAGIQEVVDCNKVFNEIKKKLGERL
ncbi:histidine--tRNA ligase [Candidatus Uhrbacteria bacterium]|nr:histidine--tRNA ligase [Candidatus Uhrbacteria bacterium]